MSVVSCPEIVKYSQIGQFYCYRVFKLTFLA